MKAISIKQPWASLIVHGIKDIENRTWKCPQKYIGQRVLIHASSSKPVFRYSFLQYDIIRRTSQSLIFNCTYDGFPKGAIIGSVVIADCVRNHPSVWAEKGCWNWVLKDAVLFEKPVMNMKGKLILWNTTSRGHSLYWLRLFQLVSRMSVLLLIIPSIFLNNVAKSFSILST